MAQFIVRHLEETVKARLKRRAARHGRSMEDEVRHILRDAVKDQNRHVSKLGSRIAAHFANVGLTTELPEFHGQAPQAVILPSRRVRPIPAKAALREKTGAATKAAAPEQEVKPPALRTFAIATKMKFHIGAQGSRPRWRFLI